MLIDITMKITEPELLDALSKDDVNLRGHIGTHFDVMDKEFPLEYTKRDGVVFDVSGITDRDICADDIDVSKVTADMFVAFCTGFYREIAYGEKGYFTAHPQLSDELIKALVERGVSIIGLDFAGARRGKEHIPVDSYCAQNGVFVVENLRNLDLLTDYESFVVYTYPVSVEGLSGLPCRVVAQTHS